MNAPYDPLLARTPGTGLDHLPSYWTATTDDFPADDGPVAAQTDTEVAIIGGGYTGLSCALFLAKHHGIRAVVLEANRPGWGCSGRNGGFARAAIGRHSYSDMIARWDRETARRWFGESLAAIDTVRALERDEAIACDLAETGHLKIAHRPARASALEQEAALLRNEFGYPAEFLPAGRGLISESQGNHVRQREFLLSELKRKLPALAEIQVTHDWWGWVCLTADFLPHVFHADDDASVHHAFGYQGSGVAYGLHAGRLLACRVAGDATQAAIPSTTSALPRFPLAALRRAGQRAMYLWYRYLDNRD